MISPLGAAVQLAWEEIQRRDQAPRDDDSCYIEGVSSPLALQRLADAIGGLAVVCNVVYSYADVTQETIPDDAGTRTDRSAESH
jgi:hypothetical protein